MTSNTVADSIVISRLAHPEELLQIDSDGEPCPVHLDLDLEDGVLTFSYRYPDSGTPESVWNRRRLHIPAAALTADFGNEILDQALPYAQRILAGATIEWDGNNDVGVLNEDARAAFDELQNLVAEACDGAPTVSAMQAADWFAEGGGPADVGLSADTTDEELTRLVEQVEADIRDMDSAIGQVTAPIGVQAYLWLERDRMRVAVDEQLDEVRRQIAELTEQRNEMITQAIGWKDKAYSTRTVGATAGLSHTHVQNIVAQVLRRRAWDNAPAWADFIAEVGDVTATRLEQVGERLGGLRCLAVGNGFVALDDEAVAVLRRQPVDGDGFVSVNPVDSGKAWVWFAGKPFALEPRQRG